MKETMLYYEVHGTRGPFLLLVHGLLSSKAQWLHNIKPLTEFCRPVIIELLGHGRSPSPEDPECYTPDQYVREFESIRNKLHTDRWFVCGQSLGASLTLRYALYHPEHFIAQIFTNSRSALSEPSPGRATTLLDRQITREGRKIIDNFPLHPSRSRHLPPDIKDALLQDVERIDIIGFKNTLLHTLPQSSVRSLLNQTKVPTLMVVGRYDKAFLPLSEMAVRLIPDLNVKVFDGGHAVNIDAATEFNTSVKEFVQKFNKTK